MARRLLVLQLLALIEHPDALPCDAALRIAGELLGWLDDEASQWTACDVSEAGRELQAA